MKPIDDAIKAVVQIRAEHVEYAGIGRCANWDEYTKLAGAVMAFDKVLAELETMRGNYDED